MEDLPTRHRNHEIETLSERYFKNCIPVSWVVNSFNIDYGTDYNCEIVEDRGVTGLNFTVQLKGKETEVNKDNILISLKRSTLNRWFNRLEPTMLIAYIVNEKEAFWIWMENNSVDLTSPNQSFTIKIPRQNKLSTIIWTDISSSVKLIFSRRHFLYTVPKVNNQNQEAWELYFENKFEKALPLFYDLIKEAGNDVSILEAIALSEYRVSNYQKALVYINKALEIDENANILLNKASILTEQGAFENNRAKINEALKIYYGLLERNFVSSSLYYNLGSALTKLEEHESSITNFKQAILLEPNNPEIWNNLGNSYMNIGEHYLEMDCYDKALSLNPDLPETLFSKGSSLFRYFGLKEEGLKLMLRATELTSRYELDNPYVFFWISECYLSKEDYRNSEIWNNKGLLFFPSDNFLSSQKERIKSKESLYR
jgi:tetratricopeptide (TPR) repeat protein